MSAFIWSVTALLIAGIGALAGLRAWRGWLDLRRFEIAQSQSVRREEPEASTTARIEMADLKERLKKLEAIATGVDL